MSKETKQIAGEFEHYSVWLRQEHHTQYRIPRDVASSLEEAIQGAKAVLIVTEHTDMVEKIRQFDLDALGVQIIIDGRNCLDPEVLIERGMLYRGIGRPK